jgi:hypothetical protein
MVDVGEASMVGSEVNIVGVLAVVNVRLPGLIVLRIDRVHNERLRSLFARLGTNDWRTYSVLGPSLSAPSSLPRR